ncbi:MAG: hypothetical protein WA705_21460 [Candidatus Ozemobacteraceae bacterium]
MTMCRITSDLRRFLLRRSRYASPILLGMTIFLMFVPVQGWGEKKAPTPAPQVLKAPSPVMSEFSFPVYYRRLEEVRVLATGTTSAPGTRAARTMPGFSGLFPANKLTKLDARLDALGAKLDVRRDALDARLDAGRDALTDSRDRLLGYVAGKRFDLIKKNNQPKPEELNEGTNTKIADDKKYSYRLTQTKVNSEEQLLRLMGVGTDTSLLTNGQRALLDIYRESRDPQFVERMKYGFQNKVSIQLTDTNGYAGENITRDFWPCSYGNLIQFSDQYFANANSGDLAKSVLVHEAAHTLDRTVLEYDQPYGPDGCHYQNELAKPKAAFAEGWAEYAQFLHFPEEASYSRKLLEKIRIEGTVAGSYTEVLPSSLTGAQLLCVEGINAAILLRIAQGVPNGADKIMQSFSATNTRDRTLATVLQDFVHRFPADASVAIQAFDTETLGKLSDTEIISMLGNTISPMDAAASGLRNRAEIITKLGSYAPITAYLAQRRAAIETAAALASETARAALASLSIDVAIDGTLTGISTSGHKVQVDQTGSTPFGE